LRNLGIPSRPQNEIIAEIEARKLTEAKNQFQAQIEAQEKMV
jgi:hypothetical protein